MKTALVGVMLFALALPVPAQEDLDTARQRLKENEPDQAAALVRQLLQQTPEDPWLRYNLGVTAYAAQDYPEADRIWQDLATTQLPRSLWKQVWTQIGNAAFRLGEPYYETAPEQTVQLWERSCEAYRVVLSESRRHPIARPNLELVEAKLAKLKIQLGDQLVEQARKQSLDPKIESLQAAVDYYREARELTPTDPEIDPRIARTEHELRAQLNLRAEREEKRGDQSSAARNSWGDRQAEQQYQDALADFERAAYQDPETASPPPAPRETPREDAAAEPQAAAAATPEKSPEVSEIQKAEAGRERVTNKLADLYARMGRQHQQQADRQAQGQPEQALENYHEALEDFAQALALDPQHADAQRGEQEVLAALEKLHMEQGRQEMMSGMNHLQNRNQMQAVGELQDALHDFQEAQAINPQNAEARMNIEQLQEILPNLLTEIGQREQAAAAQAEPQSVQRAVDHLERAEASFDRALQVQPEHQPAQAGLEQTQADLNRLRQQIAGQTQPTDPQARPQGNEPRQDPSAQRFDQMLEALDQDQARYEQGRMQGAGPNRPSQRQHSKTW